MSLNLILPFVSTAIMLVFIIFVFQRYFANRRLEFLFWGIGLTFFGLGSFSEAYLALSWNKWVFFAWYLFGAALSAAWLGQGTLYLMVKKKWRNVMTGFLIMGSLFAASVIYNAMPSWDAAVFNAEKPISEQFGTKLFFVEPGEDIPLDVDLITVRCVGDNNISEAEQSKVNRKCDGQDEVAYYLIAGIIPLGAPMRLTTPLLNSYGTLFLVGGALYSAYLFWRKRVLPNRVVANVLIAAGALLIAFASTLTRLGYGQYLYLGELLSSILMFWGFILASKPQPNEVPAAVAAASATD